MLEHLIAMAQDPRALNIFALLAASHTLVALAVGLTSWVRGIRRGKELQAMELPQSGGYRHYREGPLFETRAPTAAAAINKLLACTPKTHERPYFTRQWD